MRVFLILFLFVLPLSAAKLESHDHAQCAAEKKVLQARVVWLESQINSTGRFVQLLQSVEGAEWSYLSRQAEQEQEKFNDATREMVLLCDQRGMLYDEPTVGCKPKEEPDGEKKGAAERPQKD